MPHDKVKKIKEIQEGECEEVLIKEIHVWRQSILASLRFPLNDARYLNWAGTEESLEKAAEELLLHDKNVHILKQKCFIAMHRSIVNECEVWNL